MGSTNEQIQQCNFLEQKGLGLAVSFGDPNLGQEMIWSIRTVIEKPQVTLVN